LLRAQDPRAVTRTQLLRQGVPVKSLKKLQKRGKPKTRRPCVFYVQNKVREAQKVQGKFPCKAAYYAVLRQAAASYRQLQPAEKARYVAEAANWNATACSAHRLEEDSPDATDAATAAYAINVADRLWGPLWL